MKKTNQRKALDPIKSKLDAHQIDAGPAAQQRTLAEVIEETLTEARFALAAGEFWPLTTRIIHPDGVETLRARGYEGTPEQKMQIAVMTESWRKSLNASFVVMVADAWTCGSDKIRRPSLSPNRTESLVVTFWGADHVSYAAGQPYTRANGNLTFQPLAEFEVTAVNPFCMPEYRWQESSLS